MKDFIILFSFFRLHCRAVEACVSWGLTTSASATAITTTSWRKVRTSPFASWFASCEVTTAPFASWFASCEITTTSWGWFTTARTSASVGTEAAKSSFFTLFGFISRTRLSRSTNHWAGYFTFSWFCCCLLSGEYRRAYWFAYWFLPFSFFFGLYMFVAEAESFAIVTFFFPWRASLFFFNNDGLFLSEAWPWKHESIVSSWFSWRSFVLCCLEIISGLLRFLNATSSAPACLSFFTTGRRLVGTCSFLFFSGLKCFLLASCSRLCILLFDDNQVKQVLCIFREFLDHRLTEVVHVDLSIFFKLVSSFSQNFCLEINKGVFCWL